MDETPITTEYETPCDSNDANILLYASLLDDDTFAFDLLPCRNDTSAVTGVVNDEQTEFLIAGGGGESNSGTMVVDSTVPSRTTEAMDAEAWEEYLSTITSESVMEDGSTVEDVYANGSAQTGGDNDTPSSSSSELGDTEAASEQAQVSSNNNDESPESNSNEEESSVSSQINEASSTITDNGQNASVEGSSQGSKPAYGNENTNASGEDEVTMNGGGESAEDNTSSGKDEVTMNGEGESAEDNKDSESTDTSQTGGFSDQPNNDGTESSSISQTNEDETKDESAAAADNQEKGDGAATTLHQTTVKESTFYTCHPDPTSFQSGELTPEDASANKYEIAFDYELVTTTTDGDADVGITVTQLENVMTEELANQFDLVDCESKGKKMMLRRRNLRNKRSNGDDVVALDSDPTDKVLEGRSCTTEITDENTICTPVRGYMTVWSEGDDASSVLQSIESGMENGNYQSDNVIKMVYMGVPTEEELHTETAEVTIDTNAAQVIDDSTDSSSSMSIFLPVGISIFALALACIAVFIIRRRKHDDRDGPKQERSEPLQSQLQAPPTMDLDDDINLLPSMGKLDMSPINDTDSDTESAGAADEGGTNAPVKEVDVEECSVDTSVRSGRSSVRSGSASGSGELSVFSDEEESLRSGSAESHSGLAAIGVASTLATRVGSPDSMT